MSTADLPEDHLYRRLRRQSAVEDAELSLESHWDVVSASARVDHGSCELHVHYGCEVAWFVQVIKPTHFDSLSHYLVGHLQTKQIHECFYERFIGKCSMIVILKIMLSYLRLNYVHN